MTTEEAIAWFEMCKPGIARPGARGMYEKAIAALRAQQERENPKPLTLDELRQMDGEPVWVVPLGPNPDWVSHWCLYHDGYVYPNSVTRKGVMYFYYTERYGEAWLAYRYKPKEEPK